MQKIQKFRQREMSAADVKELIKFLLDEYGDIFHEWNTRKANRFFKESGISKRNWRIYLRHLGLVNGVCWTLRAIADEEGNISHVRVWQIVHQTSKNMRRFATTLKANR